MATYSENLGQFILDENPYADAAYYTEAIETQIGVLQGVLAELRIKMKGASIEPQARANLRATVPGYGDKVAGPGAENNGSNRIEKPKVSMPYDAVHERVMSGMFWYFGGKPHRISKAFRIPYRIPDDPEEYNLFIGYGGCGGW